MPFDVELSYLKHLQTYVGEIKREAESRALGLVTASGIYLAVVAFIVSATANLYLDKAIDHHRPLIMAAGGFAVLGGLCGIGSLLSAATAFAPRIQDPHSPMETSKIVSVELDELISRHTYCSETDIRRSILREVRAIASAHVHRSRRVRLAKSLLAAAVSCVPCSVGLLIAVVLDNAP